jgi:tRNA (guanosine-2'-O-)-methyltransferase
VACAVTLYEAYRQKTLAGHYSATKLNGEVLKELMDKWGYEEENNL